MCNYNHTKIVCFKKTNIFVILNNSFLKTGDYRSIYTKVIAVHNIGLLDKCDFSRYHKSQQTVLSFSVCKIGK